LAARAEARCLYRFTALSLYRGTPLQTHQPKLATTVKLGKAGLFQSGR
jgi:hypothetical protein